MGGSEFLRRLQPLKADMDAAYFRVYQPFHVREEDFDALLALLDEQAQKRTLNLQRTDRQTPWFKQGPAGMRFVYSDAQTPAPGSCAGAGAEGAGRGLGVVQRRALSLHGIPAANASAEDRSVA